jgi:hypothetical protein
MLKYTYILTLKIIILMTIKIDFLRLIYSPYIYAKSYSFF